MADMEAIREELHVLLDRIPDTDVPTARKFLRALADPVRAALLDAPLDNEPVSAHERAAWQADEQRRLRAEAPIPGEDLLHDLGFTDSDLH